MLKTISNIKHNQKIKSNKNNNNITKNNNNNNKVKYNKNVFHSSIKRINIPNKIKSKSIHTIPKLTFSTISSMSTTSSSTPTSTSFSTTVTTPTSTITTTTTITPIGIEPTTTVVPPSPVITPPSPSPVIIPQPPVITPISPPPPVITPTPIITPSSTNQSIMTPISTTLTDYQHEFRDYSLCLDKSETYKKTAHQCSDFISSHTNYLTSQLEQLQQQQEEYQQQNKQYQEQIALLFSKIVNNSSTTSLPTPPTPPPTNSSNKSISTTIELIKHLLNDMKQHEPISLLPTVDINEIEIMKDRPNIRFQIDFPEKHTYRCSIPPGTILKDAFIQHMIQTKQIPQIEFDTIVGLYHNTSFRKPEIDWNQPVEKVLPYITKQKADQLWGDSLVPTVGWFNTVTYDFTTNLPHLSKLHIKTGLQSSLYDTLFEIDELSDHLVIIGHSDIYDITTRQLPHQISKTATNKLVDVPDCQYSEFKEVFGHHWLQNDSNHGVYNINYHGGLINNHNNDGNNNKQSLIELKLKWQLQDKLSSKTKELLPILSPILGQNYKSHQKNYIIGLSVEIEPLKEIVTITDQVDIAATLYALFEDLSDMYFDMTTEYMISSPSVLNGQWIEIGPSFLDSESLRIGQFLTGNNQTIKIKQLDAEKLMIHTKQQLQKHS